MGLPAWQQPVAQVVRKALLPGSESSRYSCRGQWSVCSGLGQFDRVQLPEKATPEMVVAEIVVPDTVGKGVREDLSEGSTVRRQNSNEAW